MTIFRSPSGEYLQIDQTLTRLKALVADIERLKDGIHPDPLRIKGAAYIHDWSLASRSVSCLAGYVEGHPSIRSGRMAVTSDIWVWAPEAGYARTLSRYYALGPRAAKTDGRGQ